LKRPAATTRRPAAVPMRVLAPGSSPRLRVVQVRASQGRRGRDSGVLSRLRRTQRGACLGGADPDELPGVSTSQSRHARPGPGRIQLPEWGQGSRDNGIPTGGVNCSASFARRIGAGQAAIDSRPSSVRNRVRRAPS